MKGSFHEERYNFDTNIHLKTLFENRPQLFEKWKCNILTSEVDFEKIHSSHEHNNTLNLYQELKDRICVHKHLGENWENKYPHLVRLFVDDEPLENILQEVGSKPSNFIDEAIWHTEYAVLNLCLYRNTLLTEEVIQNLLELQNHVNGQTKMVAVKDSKGFIKARCMVRILLEVSGQNLPVLYREKMYFNGMSQKAKNLLEEMTQELAVMTGLKLYDFSNPPEKHSIQSIGGPAPFEYVDGAGGIMKDGIYVI